MRRLHAVRFPTILVVLALLASSAGLAVRSPGDARALLAAAFAPGTSGVGRAHGLSDDADGATRIAFVRPASPSITRSQAPTSGGSGDARGVVALTASSPHLERIALSTPASLEARRDGVPSPGQPAPSSRAPPAG
jgi:hypothetical protein